MAAWPDISNQVYARLEQEGRKDDFDSYRATLRAAGENPNVNSNTGCFVIAAFAFAPLDGTKPEALGLHGYNEVAANWAKGAYPAPPESATPVGTPIKPRPKVKPTDPWDILKGLVDPDKSAGLTPESTRWIYENYGKQPHQIKPEDVPSIGVLEHLKHITRDSAGRRYDKFLETYGVRMMPDKRTLELESRFKDDNRTQFDLLDRFMESLDTEGEADAA